MHPRPGCTARGSATRCSEIGTGADSGEKPGNGSRHFQACKAGRSVVLPGPPRAHRGPGPQPKLGLLPAPGSRQLRGACSPIRPSFAAWGRGSRYWLGPGPCPGQGRHGYELPPIALAPRGGPGWSGWQALAQPLGVSGLAVTQMQGGPGNAPLSSAAQSLLPRHRNLAFLAGGSNGCPAGWSPKRAPLPLSALGPRSRPQFRLPGPPARCARAAALQAQFRLRTALFPIALLPSCAAPPPAGDLAQPHRRGPQGGGLQRRLSASPAPHPPCCGR